MAMLREIDVYARQVNLAEAFGVQVKDVEFVCGEHFERQTDTLPCDGDVTGTPYTRKNGEVVYCVTALACDDYPSEPWAWERRSVQPYGDSSDHECGCGCGQTRVRCYRCGGVFPSGRFASKGRGKMREMCHGCADDADAREPEYSTRR
jgi:hypothetical protein